MMPFPVYYNKNAFQLNQRKKWVYFLYVMYEYAPAILAMILAANWLEKSFFCIRDIMCIYIKKTTTSSIF